MVRCWQAMLQDLLQMEDDKITYETDDKGGKRHEVTALLNETDNLWVEFRHQHIARVRRRGVNYPGPLA